MISCLTSPTVMDSVDLKWSEMCWTFIEFPNVKLSSLKNIQHICKICIVFHNFNFYLSFRQSINWNVRNFIKILKYLCSGLPRRSHCALVLELYTWTCTNPSNGMWENVFFNTFVQDYSDAATVHGVSYICQRDQSAPHRLLWLLIVSMGVFVIRMRMRIFFLR